MSASFKSNMSTSIKDISTQAKSWLTLMRQALEVQVSISTVTKTCSCSRGLPDQALAVSSKLHSDTTCAIKRGPTVRICDSFVQKHDVVNIIKLARFDDGEVLPSPHWFVDAELASSKSSFGGTFLLPSIQPEAVPETYAVVVDETTGIFHVARKGTVVYRDPVPSLTEKREAGARRKCPQKNVAAQVDPVVMPKWYNALSYGKYANMPTFGEVASPQVNRVEMPKGYTGLSHDKFAKMPTFGSFEVTSPTSTSDSIMESFTYFNTSAQTSPGVEGPTDLSIAVLDDAIIAIGRNLSQVSQIDIPESQTAASSKQSRVSADSIFFRSLITEEPISLEVPPKVSSSPSVPKSEDSAFFNFLLSKGEIKESASIIPSTKQIADSQYLESLITKEGKELAQLGKFSLVLTEIACSSLMTCKDDRSKDEETTSNLADEAPLAPVRREIDVTHMSELTNALDLAGSPSVSRPHISSELDLEVSQGQYERFLQDVDQLVAASKETTGNATGCMEQDEVRYHQAKAPRKDAMSYEEASSPDSSTTSSGQTSPAETAHLQSSDTPSTTPSTNLMFLRFGQAPVDESAWLEFHKKYNSLEVTPSDGNNQNDMPSLSPQSRTEVEVDTGAPICSLPPNDEREVQSVSDTDSLEFPVVATSIDDEFSASNLEDNSLDARLPEASLDPISTEIEKEESNDALKKAIETLDIAAIFGESSNDWSEDSGLESLDNDVPGSSSNAEAAQNGTADDDVVIDRRPLTSLFPLPSLLIWDLNQKIRQIAHEEDLSEDAYDVYYRALKHLRLTPKDVHKDLKHWCHDVRTAYDIQVAEHVYDKHVYLFDVAISEIQWWFFCCQLKELPRVEQQPKFEVAESSKGLLLEVLGIETQYHQILSSISDTASPPDDSAETCQNSGLSDQAIATDNDVDDVFDPQEEPFWRDLRLCKWAMKRNHLFVLYPGNGESKPPSRKPLAPQLKNPSPATKDFTPEDWQLDYSHQETEIDAATEVVAEDSISGNVDEADEVEISEIDALLLEVLNQAELAEQVATGPSDDDDEEVAAPIASASHLPLSNEVDDVEKTIEELGEFQNVDECSGEKDDIDLAIALAENSSSAETSRRSSGATYPSEGTEPTDLEDYDTSEEPDSSFSNNLRPHRFFTVEAPNAAISAAHIFPKQIITEAALEKILRDLPDLSSDEDDEEFVADSPACMQGLTV